MRTLGIIPAREGSKGIIKKNLCYVGGMTLIARVAEQGLASRLHRLVCSTDGKEIAAHARAAGLETWMRPVTLAMDTTPMIEVVQFVLKQVKEDFDAVMVLQPTSPLRTHKDINHCLKLLKHSDSVCSYVDVGERHPARMIWADSREPVWEPPVENQRRQELPQVLLRNGAIYAARTDVIERGTFYGAMHRPYIMPFLRSWNIDESVDMAVCNALWEYSKCV